MPARRWEPTEAEIAVLRRHNNTEAARRLGRAKNTVQRIRAEYAIPNPGRRLDELPEDETPPVDTEADGARLAPSGVWEIPPDFATFHNGLWAALERVQDEMLGRDTEMTEVDVPLADDAPVLVAYVADIHLGHTQSRLDLIRRDFERIHNTPGMYCILGGDLTDNVVTSIATRGSYHEQLTPLRIQRALIDEALAFVGPDNVLALILGNHDAWTQRDVDFDPIAYLAHKLQRPYLGPFGFLNLTLGSQRYRVLAAHQFRMRSSFNATHQAKRLEDFTGDGADIVFTGHTHEPAAESTYRRGAAKFYGQAGSYLLSSRYSKSLGFGHVTADMPGAVIFPEQHKVIGVRDAFEDGIHLLSSYRSDVCCPCAHCAKGAA